MLLLNCSLDRDITLAGELYDAFTKDVYADIYIVAHTTSPFIKHTTIVNSLNQILEYGYDSAFSAEKIQTFTWYKEQPLNYNLKLVPRTQDICPIFVETSRLIILKCQE
jgi:CMP-N-acetylneuraminic acid synthetase